MTPKTLHVSNDLQLPIDAVTRRMAILAMSGAGKSNTAVVIAEAMFDARMPWVAIDPKGDWWGIRSSKTGKGPGLPIPIFGGLRGDVRLEPHAGKMIADLIVDQRLTCVLDVSEFDTRQEMWGFLADLGETLLRRNRSAMHLFLEECDEYIPQKTAERGNLPRCLGVWQRVVKRGRFRGLGSTQITQRSASLNKDTLYQAEVLIAMRAAGAGDRKAIEGWVEHHNASEEIIASLPTLADGEAWVSSPAWLRETRRVRFNRRRTFDSGATPVLLESKAPPATLADVDLEQLRERMAETIERAKADDPAALRAELAAARAQITALEKRPPAAGKTVERNVISAKALAALQAMLTSVERSLAVVRQAEENAHALIEKAEAGRVSVMETGRALAEALREMQALVTPDRHTGDVSIVVHPHVERPAPAPRRPAAGGEAPDDDGLSVPRRAILSVVAMLDRRGITATRETVARWLDLHPNGGRYGANLKWLREAGYLSEFRLTESGAAAAEGLGAGLAGALRPLTEGEKRIVGHLAGDRAARYTRETLAAALGLHANGGRYGANLRRLRQMGLIPASGAIHLTEAAFR